MLECKRCGAMLAPTDKFCTNCGTPTGLGESVAAQEALEPEQEAANLADGTEAEKTAEAANESAEPVYEEAKKEKGSIDWPDSKESHAKPEAQPEHKPEPERKPAPAAAVSGGNKTKKVLIPEAYKPLGMWSYFGYEVLFAIPCIGVIFLLIYALGGTENINLKNFARSHFCFSILMCILAVIAAVLIAIFGRNTGF